MATKTKAKKDPMEEFEARIAAQLAFAAKAEKDGDYELARAAAHDAADLKCIYSAYKAKDYACAMRIADRVDTAVRDEIPTQIFNQMAKAMGQS